MHGRPVEELYQATKQACDWWSVRGAEDGMVGWLESSPSIGDIQRSHVQRAMIALTLQGI